MPVQDDVRERELVRMFNLVWDRAHQRSGVDAHLTLLVGGRQVQLEVEVKSTTGTSVSTARDVGIEHIDKWRRKLFVFGFYTKETHPELRTTLCLTPSDMEPWIAGIEKKIAVDFRLASLSSAKLNMSDMFSILGEKEHYTVADAKSLHKRQWSTAQYMAARDVTIGRKLAISKGKMLEILRLRSKYIAERGATLNNPHIKKTFLQPFFGTDREVASGNWAEAVRRIARDFIASSPEHPSIHY